MDTGFDYYPSSGIRQNLGRECEIGKENDIRKSNDRSLGRGILVIIGAGMGAIPHLLGRLFLIGWENNRDCHITMPLSLKTMEVQIKGEQ